MLYLGSDHRGFALKEEIKKFLSKKNILYQDLGNKILDPEDDFVDFASLVAQKVQTEKEARGIVICGSGVGVCIAANKYKNIRCGIATTKEMVHSAREHDDINILALSADILSVEQVQEIVEEFLNTPFSSAEKYSRRIEKINKIEEQW
ncbi:RpiB/LacA/LacB family sugar-phosphate isomerase [Candidatus Microgenomates bacterium]|nr:RpiB/LacA/LacB family sugar-phosphate isomerase [Candidatus Microgenomates bacterium]